MAVVSAAVPGAILASSAHCSFAPSIWRRLLMQAFFCAVVRAFTKLGIAIAARRPMMATTIMISTSVKPAFRLVLLMFILFACGVNMTNGGLLLVLLRCSRIATDQPHLHI